MKRPALSVLILVAVVTGGVIGFLLSRMEPAAEPEQSAVDSEPGVQPAPIVSGSRPDVRLPEWDGAIYPDGAVPGEAIVY
ncbi:MAG: hypothetical protein ACPGKS_09245, partial [Coraliomargarita sp.]